MGGKGFSLCGGGCGLVNTSEMGESASPGNGGTGGIKLLKSEGRVDGEADSEASVRCIRLLARNHTRRVQGRTERSRVVDCPSILPQNALVFALTEFFVDWRKSLNRQARKNKRQTLSLSTLEVVLDRGLVMTQSDPLGLAGSLGVFTSLLEGAVMDNLGGKGDFELVAERGRDREQEVGKGGRGSGRFSLSFCAVASAGDTTPPLSFALRMRVAKSGLLDVPGER